MKADHNISGARTGRVEFANASAAATPLTTAVRFQVAALLLYGFAFGGLAIALGQVVLGAAVLAAFAWGGWQYFGPGRRARPQRAPEMRRTDVVAPLGRRGVPEASEPAKAA